MRQRHHTGSSRSGRLQRRCQSLTSYNIVDFVGSRTTLKTSPQSGQVMVLVGIRYSFLPSNLKSRAPAFQRDAAQFSDDRALTSPRSRAAQEIWTSALGDALPVRARYVRRP